jgi:hypothetical protein
MSREDSPLGVEERLAALAHVYLEMRLPHKMSVSARSNARAATAPGFNNAVRKMQPSHNGSPLMGSEFISMFARTYNSGGPARRAMVRRYEQHRDR